MKRWIIAIVIAAWACSQIPAGSVCVRKDEAQKVLGGDSGPPDQGTDSRAD